jgi:hypothetical protein
MLACQHLVFVRAAASLHWKEPCSLAHMAGLKRGKGALSGTPVLDPRCTGSENDIRKKSAHGKGSVVGQMDFEFRSSIRIGTSLQQTGTVAQVADCRSCNERGAADEVEHAVCQTARAIGVDA